ncbi:MAG TPA: peptidyl-prolyl cis-trans isomerase [Acidobacteriaceae bacterium]|jgi:peptidyl-prolyl cis-trans isomerase SurA|nr:peptidyl-prolyl cis-trans isomerase [Acidobacteriaceae bacterium]
MMLRVPSFSAALAASVLLTAVPAFSQSRGSNFADTQQQQQSPYHGQIVEDIVAYVNDQVISKSDYDRAEQELEQEARQQGWSQQQLFEQRKDLLRSLIDNQLLLSKGKELGITGETEVIKRLDDMRKQYHLDSMEDLQKAAEQQGVSFEDLKEQIRENVIRSEVISQEVGSHIQIAPSEIEAYYKAHQQDFQRPEQVKLSEILVATPNPDDAAQVAQAEKKADDIETRLRGGADFATVAKADSNGPTAADGGRLGEFKRGDLAKVLENASFDLKAGQFTEPLRTKQGWLILEVTDHQQAGLAPLDQVQNQIQETLGYAKMEPALRTYLAQLRDQAYIEIRSGYMDSGATGHEQKFLMGAYMPPQPKHHKHEERARFRQKSVKKQKETETANAGPPAGVPTLDKVNSQKDAPKEVATTKTQKPGKREKIRFGQAPRETLPAGDTREVDAGAGADTSATTQMAANQPANSVVTNAEGNVIDTGNESDKKNKTRFSDRPKETKAKREKDQQAKKDRFAPPKETAAEVAQDKQEQSALGLNGDTTKKKKANPAKGGPKRRLSDEDKNQDKTKDQQPNGSGAAGPSSTTPPSTGGTQGTGSPQ